MYIKSLKLGSLIILFVATSCASQEKGKQEVPSAVVDLEAILDTIWTTEQTPIRKRDEMLDKYGADSEEFAKYQAIYEKNHIINESKVKEILDKGWPDVKVIGEQGNRTICNVLQHSDYATRVEYLSLMRQAVKNQQLSPQLLVRAEDRLATDRGELQIYGGQMKYYPETKSFNVWPVLDPVNIDKRRAETGLGPIAEHLKNRFDFEWNLEEQIKRTEEFEKERINRMK